MSEKLQAVLKASVEEVLERMFFIQSLEELDDLGDEPQIAAQVTFEGTPSGWLALSMATAAARSVAADFLGSGEGQLSEAQTGEVICELANMICGSVLSRVESTSTFHLRKPGLLPRPWSSSRWPGDPGETAFAVTYAAEMGNGRIRVIFNPAEPAWSTAEKSAF